MEIHVFDSNIGKIAIFEEDNFIVKVELATKLKNNDTNSHIIQKTKSQIIEYLEGHRENFNIPYKTQGTPFQQAILKTISEIPFGKTISYNQLAKISGFDKAYRACGTVCKNNILPLIIPCHRVIKADGRIGNYNAGVALKKRLLEHEKLFQK